MVTPKEPPIRPVKPPVNPSEWMDYVMSIGLQQFGDRQVAQIFERQMRLESANYSPKVIYGPPADPGAAQGLAQYMPAMVKSRGINPWDPFEQVPDAANWMNQYFTKYEGDSRKALTAYVSGEPWLDALIAKYGDEWEQHLPNDYMGNQTRTYLQRIVPVTPSYPAPTFGELPPEDIRPSIPIYEDYNRDVQTEIDTFRLARTNYEQRMSEIDVAINSVYKGIGEEMHLEQRFIGTAIVLMPEWGMPILPPEEMYEKRNIKAALEAEAAALTARVVRTQLRAQYINSLPRLINEGRVASEDDAVQIMSSQRSMGALTEEDEAWAKDLFRKLSPALTPSPDSPPLPVDELYQAMAERPRPRPVGIHLLTDQALLKALTEMYVPSMPGGLTTDELLDLYRRAGLDDPAVEAMAQEQFPSADDLIKDMVDLQELYAAYIAGTKKPELPPLSFWEWVRMATTQPMLFAIEALEPYQRYIIEPWAGFLHMEVFPRLSMPGVPIPMWTVAGGAGLFGLQRREDLDKMQALMQQVRTEGLPYETEPLTDLTAEAYGYVWREGGGPGWYRLFAEVVVDPLNALDVGFAAALKSRYIMRLPGIGRFLGEMDRVLMGIANFPFDVLRAGRTWIPQTTRQVAAGFERRFLEDVFPAAMRRTGAINRQAIPADGMRSTIREAGRAWLTTPPAHPPNSPGEMVGSIVTMMEFIDEDEIIEMASRLGVPDYIPTQNSIMTINSIVERVSPLAAEGLDNGILKIGPAADILLGTLKATPTNADRLVARSIITERVGRVLRNIDNMTSPDSVHSMLLRTQTWIRETHVANVASKAHSMRMNQRALSSVLDRADWIGKVVWRDWIERQIVSPVASHYLLFKNYGPPNVLETAVRSFLDGGSVTAGKDPYTFVESVVGDMMNVPVEVQRVEARLEMRIPESTRNALRSRQPVRYRMEQVTEPVLLERIPGIMAPIEPLREPVRRFFQRVFGKDIDITSLLEENLFWGELASKIRQNNYGTGFINTLREANPEELASIAKAIPDINTLGIEFIPQKELVHIREMLFNYGTRGPEQAELIKDTLRVIDNQRAVQQVSQHMQRDMITPIPIKDSVMAEVRTGRVWKDIDGTMRDAQGMAYDMRVTQIAHAEMAYRQMADDIDKLAIDSTDQLYHLFRNASESADYIRSIVDTTREATQSKAMGILDFGQRSQLHDVSYDYIKAFLDSATESTDRVFAKLDEAVRRLDPKDAPYMLSSLDQFRLEVDVWRTFRVREAAIFAKNKPKKPPGGPANHAWWNKVNAERAENWNDATKLIEGVKSEIETLNTLITMEKLPKPRRSRIKGRVTVDDVRYLYSTTGDAVHRSLYDEKLQAFIGRSKWKTAVRSRANAVGKPYNLNADLMGFTSESLDEVYDTIIRSVNIDPAEVKLLTPQYEMLEGLRMELHNVQQTMGVPENEIAKLTKWVDDSVENMKNLPMFRDEAGRTAWIAKRQAATDATTTKFRVTFTDYTEDNVVGAVMHGILPFWNYELQRYPWLWRTFVKHPGIATGLARYMDYTDGGYVPIPFTSISVNLMKGSVLMGGFRQLYMRDYPEYYDAFPGFSNVMDWIGRIGFFPNILATGALTMIFNTEVNRRPEIADILPAWVRSPIAFLAWALPDSTAARKLREIVMPSRFLNYMTIKACAEAGENGRDLFDLIVTGKPLTEDEQKIWDRGMSKASFFEGLLAQGLPFRYDPPDNRELWDTVAQVREDFQGIPKEIQRKISRRAAVTGKRFADYYPLPPVAQTVINSLENMQLWAGATLPLQPSHIQRIEANLGLYYKDVEKIVERAMGGVFDEEGELTTPGQIQIDESLMAGEISTDRWTREMGEIRGRVASEIGGLQNSVQYRETPIKLEKRLEYYLEEKGIQYTQHPAKELMQMFWEIKPEWRYDWDSETYTWDYDTYYIMQTWLLEAIPEEFREDMVRTIQEEYTPLQRLHWDTYRKYLRPYNNTRLVGLRQYSPEDQAIIRRFEGAATTTERDELRQHIHAESGEQLIAHFQSELSQVRQTWRLLDPELNAWVSFWRPGTALLRPEAVKLHDQLVKEHLGR